MISFTNLMKVVVIFKHLTGNKARSPKFEILTNYQQVN